MKKSETPLIGQRHIASLPLVIAEGEEDVLVVGSVQLDPARLPFPTVEDCLILPVHQPSDAGPRLVGFMMARKDGDADKPEASADSADNQGA